MISREDLGALLVFAGIVVLGAFLGFIAGHVIWFLYGQIQLFLGVSHPYAVLYGPPLYYQIAWTIAGVFGILKMIK